MPAYLRTHKTLTTLLLCAFSIAEMVAWDCSARVRGKLVARFDLARGHYEVLTLGLPAPWRPEAARLLRERYKIEMRVVAGCMVSESLLAYVDAYNKVSMSAAKLKFGHDVFQESTNDAVLNLRLLKRQRSNP